MLPWGERDSSSAPSAPLTPSGLRNQEAARHRYAVLTLCRLVKSEWQNRPDCPSREGSRGMTLDKNAGGHRFDDREKCAKCGMTRNQWDKTQERCTGRPKDEPKVLSTDELLDQ